MRVTLRLVVAIWALILVVLGAFTFLTIREERQRLLTDLTRRATLVGEGVREAVEPAARRGSQPAIARVLRRLAQPARRIVVFDRLGSPITAAPGDVDATGPAPPDVAQAVATRTPSEGLREISGAWVYVYATPLMGENERVIGAVAAILDAAAVNAVVTDRLRSNALRALVLATGLSIVTILIVRATVTRPLSAMAGWTKALKSGRAATPPAADAGLFGPLAIEVAGLARNLYRARPPPR